jgi:hypothetical protein
MIASFLRITILSLVVCVNCAIAHAAPRAAAPEENEPQQQFAVLRTGRLLAGTESLTNAEANCSISGAGASATMQCHVAGATPKALYHYNTALLAEPDGTAYVIACRVPLILVLCKKVEPGSVIEGRVDKDKGLLAVRDGDKIRRYQILTSANVGPLSLTQAPPAKPPAASSKSSNGKSTESRPAERASDLSAACISATSACVSFVSEPAGADIYVDGKFAGNTPSMLVLLPGAHELRIQAETSAPWSRQLEASAGSRVTIHAMLQPQAR